MSSVTGEKPLQRLSTMAGDFKSHRQPIIPLGNAHVKMELERTHHWRVVGSCTLRRDCSAFVSGLGENDHARTAVGQQAHHTIFAGFAEEPLLTSVVSPTMYMVHDTGFKRKGSSNFN